MALRGYLYYFVEGNIESAVDGPGVFELYDHGELIYLGFSTSSVRETLRGHFAGTYGEATRSASAFRAMSSRNPVKRHAFLLKSYEAVRGELPRINRFGTPAEPIDAP